MYAYNEFDARFVRGRVAEFRKQIERRIDGSLTEDEFKPLRLKNGLYLQLHAYMLRVAIPYGTLNSRQMTALVIAASVFAVKGGIAFGSAIPGFTLALTGFVIDAPQTESAKFGIQLAFAIIPAAIMIPAAIALLFYGINRNVIARVESDLAVRRSQS